MKPDFRYLRFPLALFLLALGFCVALYLGSGWHEAEVLNAFYSQERSFNTAKRKFEEANRNRSLYERYLTDYLALLQQGLIGEERRLNWIELLQTLDKKLSLPALNYKIEAKKPAELLGLKANKNIDVYQSDMGISAETLHEEDLFYLLDEMQKEASGFYVLNQCKLASNISQQVPAFSPKRGNLSIECGLSWITVVVKS